MVLIQFAQFNFSRDRSRTPLGTKVNFFVITTNDSQPLTVVTKNFILEAADVLDLPLSRLQYDRRQISPGQCSHQALHPLCFSSAK